MTVTPMALWMARARAAGPQRVPVGTPATEGLLRLVEPDASAVWLVRDQPETAGPGLLDELGLAGSVVEQPNDTARVLAAVLRCCWADPTGPIWPGAVACWPAVTSVFRAFADRDEGAFRRAAVAAVRRLHGSGWVLWDEPGQQVRLGPRVATWSQADLTVLREVHRQMPPPAPATPTSPAAPSSPAEADA
jgi:hypothetical protein